MDMLVLRSPHPPKPHLVATRITKTAGDGNSTQEVITEWRPHVITGYIISTTAGVVSRFICGENGSGTMRYTSVGSYTTNKRYWSSTDISCENSAADGWSVTIAFNHRGYTITWTETKTNGGVTATFEFVAIRGKNCWYNQLTPPADSGTENYTGAGFDPDVIFCFSWKSTTDASTGWGHTIAGWIQDCTMARSSSIVEPGHSWVMFRSGSPNGWYGAGEAITDGFKVQWAKTGNGPVVTVDCWALEYDDVAVDEYTTAPIFGDTDIITGCGFTPIFSMSGGRFDDNSNSSGMETPNGQMCYWRWALNQYYGSVDVDNRHLGTTSNYWLVNTTFTSGTVTENVTKSGSPGAGTNPYNKTLALGEDSGAIRRGT